jgi:hypothetical protein
MTFFIALFLRGKHSRRGIVPVVEKPEFPIGVVMQRRPARSKWADTVWEPIGVVPGYAERAEPRLLVEEGGMAQWLHSGFTLQLHRDECEGYYLNVSSQRARVFVLWRMESGSGAEYALPVQVTVSSEEAGRWMDGGHSVDGVPMPAEIYVWTGTYVEQNYRPEPQKRIKPRSFVHPKDRV